MQSRINTFFLIVLAASSCSNYCFGQKNTTVPKIHAHNDYHQDSPFFAAYQAGAQSIEVDLILKNNELFVAHGNEEIQANRTFEKLYVKPLYYLMQQGEFVNSIALLVDLKSEAIPTLLKVVEVCNKYPELFNKELHGVKLVISGNRPPQQNYSSYPDYVYFDGRNPKEKKERGGDKIKIISRDFSDFTMWRGKGSLPTTDSIKLNDFVSECHNQNTEVRFWNTPDEASVYKALLNIKVDYLNTDHPFELARFLDTLDTGKSLPEWQKGYLDIHHIHTGRGVAAFAIFPDGTTLLVDMGDMSETQTRVLSHRNSPLLPNYSKTPAQWVADYIQQFHPKKERSNLDYALISHYHGDHFGETDQYRKIEPQGGYQLTGITELGSILPISVLIDRGFSYPIDLKNEAVCKKFNLDVKNDETMSMLDSYWKFIDYKGKTNGMIHQELNIGDENQISLKNAGSEFKNFKVMGLFANGQIKNSKGEIISRFKEGSYPGENPLSVGIKINYGDFDYYTGGDINGVNEFGEEDTTSVEYRYGPLIGEVDVATLNHHGNRDSQSKGFVSALHPKVWVDQAWSSDHPGDDVLKRIGSEKLYPGERDIFSTGLLKANHLVIGGNVDRLFKALSGHIVVRVYPSGEKYSVFVLNDKTISRNIVAQFDYSSR
jgi:beta-lactamase superfamily II metal-dependent hydrolase